MGTDRRTSSQAIGIISLMVIVTCAVSYYSVRATQTRGLPPVQLIDAPPTSKPATTPPPQTESSGSAAPAETSGLPRSPVNADLVVHVAGAVVRPGVYHLSAGARVIDAVNAAGGATGSADTNSINLAAAVSDGSRVYIPQSGEHGANNENAATSAGGVATVVGHTTNSQTGTQQPADAGAPASTSTSEPNTDKLTDPHQGSVNINTAGIDELQRLPGVGPAIAQRIVAYREEHGGFRSPDELRGVSGIGDKKYAKLAPFIRVN